MNHRDGSDEGKGQMMSEPAKQKATYSVITLLGSFLVSAITTTYTVTRVVGKLESDIRDNASRIHSLEAYAESHAAVDRQMQQNDRQFQMEVITRLTRLETSQQAMLQRVDPNR